MLGSGGALLHDLAGDDLIAVSTGEDGRQDFRLTAPIGNAEHIGGVRAVILLDRRVVQFLLGDPKIGHIAVVNVDLAVQDRLDVLGKEFHDLHALALGYADGKNLGIVHEIPVILNDIAAEFLLVQRAVLQSLHKGLFVVAGPDILGGFQKPINSTHHFASLLAMARRISVSGSTDTIKMLKIPSGSREDRLKARL